MPNPPKVSIPFNPIVNRDIAVWNTHGCPAGGKGEAANETPNAHFPVFGWFHPHSIQLGCVLSPFPSLRSLALHR